MSIFTKNPDPSLPIKPFSSSNCTENAPLQSSVQTQIKQLPLNPYGVKQVQHVENEQLEIQSKCAFGSEIQPSVVKHQTLPLRKEEAMMKEEMQIGVNVHTVDSMRNSSKETNQSAATKIQENQSSKEVSGVDLNAVQNIPLPKSTTQTIVSVQEAIKSEQKATAINMSTQTVVIPINESQPFVNQKEQNLVATNVRKINQVNEAPTKLNNQKSGQQCVDAQEISLEKKISSQHSYEFKKSEEEKQWQLKIQQLNNILKERTERSNTLITTNGQLEINLQKFKGEVKLANGKIQYLTQQIGSKSMQEKRSHQLPMWREKKNEAQINYQKVLDQKNKVLQQLEEVQIQIIEIRNKISELEQNLEEERKRTKRRIIQEKLRRLLFECKDQFELKENELMEESESPQSILLQRSFIVNEEQKTLRAVQHLLYDYSKAEERSRAQKDMMEVFKNQCEIQRVKQSTLLNSRMSEQQQNVLESKANQQNNVGETILQKQLNKDQQKEGIEKMIEENTVQQKGEGQSQDLIPLIGQQQIIQQNQLEQNELQNKLEIQQRERNHFKQCDTRRMGKREFNKSIQQLYFNRQITKEEFELMIEQSGLLKRLRIIVSLQIKGEKSEGFVQYRDEVLKIYRKISGKQREGVPINREDTARLLELERHINMESLEQPLNYPIELFKKDLSVLLREKTEQEIIQFKKSIKEEEELIVNSELKFKQMVSEMEKEEKQILRVKEEYKRVAIELQRMENEEEIKGEEKDEMRNKLNREIQRETLKQDIELEGVNMGLNREMELKGRLDQLRGMNEEAKRERTKVNEQLHNRRQELQRVEDLGKGYLESINSYLKRASDKSKEEKLNSLRDQLRERQESEVFSTISARRR